MAAFENGRPVDPMPELLDGETCYVYVGEASLSRSDLAVEMIGESANAGAIGESTHAGVIGAEYAGTDAQQSSSRPVGAMVDLGRGELFVTDQRVVFRTGVDTFAWPMSAVSEVTRSFRASDTVQFRAAGEGPVIYRGGRAREVYATIRHFERTHVPKWFRSYDDARARHAAGETINVGPGLVALLGVILIATLMLRGLWTLLAGH